MENKVEAKPLNIYQKLCIILGEVSAIPKEGWNDHFKYKFMREADVAAVMRTLLSKYGVFIIPTIESLEYHEVVGERSKQNFCHAKVKYTFVNAENPEDRFETIHYGDSCDADSGDKALYKALTGCHKYFFIRTFSLGSEEDVENDSPSQSRGTSHSSAAAPVPRSNGSAATQGATGDYAYSFPYKVDGVSLDEMKQIREKIKKVGGGKFFYKKEGGDDCWHCERKLEVKDGFPAWLVASLVAPPAAAPVQQALKPGEPGPRVVDAGDLIVGDHEQAETSSQDLTGDDDIPF